VVEAVASGRVGAGVEERADRLEEAVLGREVQRGDALAVLGAAEGGGAARVGAEGAQASAVPR
jgi:hypothetical protein